MTIENIFEAICSFIASMSVKAEVMYLYKDGRKYPCIVFPDFAK
jgi:hypothetical protein